MSGTPQLRSAWPTTPQSGLQRRRPDISSPVQKAKPDISPSKPQPSHINKQPALTFVDAPTQRFYVSSIYIGFWLWRIYDFATLSADGRDGFARFTKWVGVDTAFLYSLSALNIPWLQWSSSTFTALFILHAALNWAMMFQIPIPLFAWLGTFLKVFYDREYAVSERYVKPASILHNASVILGKQIIHILPEGSAMLNPEGTAFCIGGSNSVIDLPIRINQTSPILIDLSRIDLDSNVQETISLSEKDVKRLQKKSAREFGKRGPTEPAILHHSVRQTGLYHLQTVIDETKLEVRRSASYALVLKCPEARIQPAPTDKCRGDLSDFRLQVEGTPPLQLRYNKVINRVNHGHTVLTIQPDSSKLQLPSRGSTDALIKHDAMLGTDVSWTKSQLLDVPLNESMGVSGGWQYTIEEITDAFGNKVSYNFTQSSSSRQALALEQHFFVHERPHLTLKDCDKLGAIKVMKGAATTLKMRATSLGSESLEEGSYNLKYLFTPEAEVTSEMRHSPSATLHETEVMLSARGYGGIQIKQPGLYSLDGISSNFCGGEVLEPSSCQLINPVEPDLMMRWDRIPDKCAGNYVGFMVDLDLLGSPPFFVRYETIRSPGGPTKSQTVQIDNFHTQWELRPPYAGHYRYEFSAIRDTVYFEERSLTHKNFVLEQDVKPPASADFSGSGMKRHLCLGEPLSFDIDLHGEAPFTLNYELVHRGRRDKRSASEISTSSYQLDIEPLQEGGEYVLSLTGIVDATGCKQSLEKQKVFTLGLQRPRVSFGLIDGKRTIEAIEGSQISLPLRLQGEKPFTITLRNTGDPQGSTLDSDSWSPNSNVEVGAEGTYELVRMKDITCPGSVDPAASQFTVKWIPRPTVALSASPLVDGSKTPAEKRAVCVGDEDSSDFSFSGHAPYDVEYEVRFKSERGSQSSSKKDFVAGLDTASIKMETTDAGLYTYQISKLGDSSYRHNARKFQPLSIQQRVHATPEAHFTASGKTYRYCKDMDGTQENIPISLKGVPPFQLELEIKHQTSAKPERINVPNVDSNQYNLRIPKRALALGSHSVIIRKIQDANGCQRVYDTNPPQAHVSVADVPGISPLEEQIDFCVGDRISFALSGTPPFSVFYDFQGREKKAKVPSTDFRRIAEQPGTFAITAVSDARSTESCRAKVDILKHIHELPSVRVSKGKTVTVDIHEGGQASMLFEFGGTPPFHFTYTRSTTPSTKGSKKPTILETKHGVSHEHSMTIQASDEGLYEVVSIRDKYCGYSAQQGQAR